MKIQLFLKIAETDTITTTTAGAAAAIRGSKGVLKFNGHGII